MLYELKLIPSKAESSILGFQSIKVLSPATCFRTDTAEADFDHKGTRIPPRQIHHNWFMCEADGDLMPITEDDLYHDVSEIRCYRLVQKSSVPHKLRTILEKLASIEADYNKNGDYYDSQTEDLCKLRDEAQSLVPEKWKDLFNLLIKAGMINVKLIDDSDRYQSLSFLPQRFVLGEGNGLDIEAYIKDGGDGVSWRPGRGETREGSYQNFFQNLAGDDFKVTVEKPTGIKVTIINYPVTFSFYPGVEFPKFKYGCKVRKLALIVAMERLKIPSPSHSYKDYVVESIEYEGENEIWQLGS